MASSCRAALVDRPLVSDLLRHGRADGVEGGIEFAKGGEGEFQILAVERPLEKAREDGQSTAGTGATAGCLDGGAHRRTQSLSEMKEPAHIFGVGGFEDTGLDTLTPTWGV